MEENSVIMQQTWEMLPKSQDDSSTINDAISDALDDHNNDIDAHLGPNQAIQSHRAAEIIDHLAESVVNDKLSPISRAYTAIVDPSTEYDYDSLESALEYVIAHGGGRILVRAGDHYVSTVVEVPKGIYISGEGALVTKIYCINASGAAIKFVDGAVVDDGISVIENLSFVRSSGTAIDCSELSEDSASKTIVSRCTFEGGGTYVSNSTVELMLDNCIVNCSTTGAFLGSGLSANDTDFVSTGAGIAADGGTNISTPMRLVFERCSFDMTASEIIKGAIQSSYFTGCRYKLINSTLPASSQYALNNRFFSCEFLLKDSGNGTISADVNLYLACNFINNNSDNDNGYISLTSTSARNVINGCYLQHDIRSDTGAFNVKSNNVTIIPANEDPGQYTVPTFTELTIGAGGSGLSSPTYMLDYSGQKMYKGYYNSNKIDVFTLSGNTFNFSSTIDLPSTHKSATLVASLYANSFVLQLYGGGGYAIFNVGTSTITFFAYMPADFVGGWFPAKVSADGTRIAYSYYYDSSQRPQIHIADMITNPLQDFDTIGISLPATDGSGEHSVIFMLAATNDLKYIAGCGDSNSSVGLALNSEDNLIRLNASQMNLGSPVYKIMMTEDQNIIGIDNDSGIPFIRKMNDSGGYISGAVYGYPDQNLYTVFCSSDQQYIYFSSYSPNAIFVYKKVDDSIFLVSKMTGMSFVPDSNSTITGNNNIHQSQDDRTKFFRLS